MLIECGLHLCPGRRRNSIEKSFRLHDHSRNAMATLGSLLLDECALQRMRLLWLTQAFESDNLLAGYCFDRRYAGPVWFAVHQDRTGSALRETAAELGSI